MSFRDYDDLVQTIGRWLARDDLPLAIADFVWLAEADIQREIKMRMRDALATGTTVNEQQWIDLPADYAEGGLLRWTSDDTLPPVEVGSYARVDAVQKYKSQALAGATLNVGVLHGTRLYIGPTPGTVDWELFYKAGAQHLSSTVRTNQLLVDYPDCLLYGSLLQSAPYLGADERIPAWRSFYKGDPTDPNDIGCLGSARQQEWRARSGHGALVMKPDRRVS